MEILLILRTIFLTTFLICKFPIPTFMICLIENPIRRKYEAMQIDGAYTMY